MYRLTSTRENIAIQIVESNGVARSIGPLQSFDTAHLTKAISARITAGDLTMVDITDTINLGPNEASDIVNGVGGGGGNGGDGWAPVISLVADGARIVMRVTDWVGGTTAKPTVNLYISASGLTATLASAIDVRGTAGAQGTQGVQGVAGTTGTAGAAGRSITNHALTSTVGLVKTYTITFSDSSTTTYTVTDGAAGAQGIQGNTGTTGNTGATGKGITSISLTNTTGLVKTYTITYSDTTTSTFAVSDGAAGSGGGGSIPNLITITAAHTVVAGNLGNTLVYDSASNADITIPNDTALSLSGVTNNSFEIYQKANGVPNIIAGSGVTLVKWTGYPTSALGVTQVAHRVGVNIWAVK